MNMISAQRLPALAKRWLPTVAFPTNYIAAREALAACLSFDECKDWADKYAALASYHKQRKDTALRDMAVRIQTRAEERIGELLLSIPRGKAQRASNGQISQQDPNTRHRIAKRVGIGSALKNRAIGIASVPKEIRNDRIEASPPISPTKLAQLGHQYRASPSIARMERGIAISRGGEVGKFWEWTRAHRPEQVAADFTAEDLRYLGPKIRDLMEWLDVFELALPRKR